MSKTCPQCGRTTESGNGTPSLCASCTGAVAAAAPAKPAGYNPNSVGIGVLALIGSLVPVVGVIVSVTGMLMAWREYRTARRLLPLIGLALCGAGLLTSILFAITGGPLSSYMVTTGE